METNENINEAHENKQDQVIENKDEPKYNYDRINRNTRANFYKSRDKVFWDTSKKGTYNVGRNKAKLEKRNKEAENDKTS